MESLRVNGSIPTVSFSGLTSSAEYTINYSDLFTGEEFSASAVAIDNIATFTLNAKFAKYDADLEASVYDSSNEIVATTNIDVVRPYCDIAQLATDLNKTYAEAKELERLARYTIDSEIPRPFKFAKKQKEFIGNGSDYLVMDEKIHKLYKVYENKELVYDLDSATNDYVFEISKDRTSIVPLQDEVPQNNTEYPRVWRDRYLGRAFADGYDYIVEAEFGYKVIPQDIQEAVQMLAADLSADTLKYTNNYIESFDNQDFKIKFSKNYISGTGNLSVDRILTKYKNEIKIGVL